MLKKIFSVIVLIILTAFVSNAQVPQLINYQGMLTDTEDNLISGDRSIEFKIYDSATDGTALWTETQTVTINEGLFSVLLGSVTPIPYSVFDGSDRYLTLQVGTDSEMAPRKRLVSVGYSFRACDADKLNGKDDSTFVQSVDGVSPDGSGNIDLVAGSNVTITPDDSNNQITISATPGGGEDNDWTISGNDMYSAVSGNVGIKTTSPSATLDVGAGGIRGSEDDVVIGDIRGSGGRAGLELHTPTKSGAITYHPDEGMNLWVDGGGTWLSAVNVLPNGFVGIGTTSPQGGLHVSGNAGAGTALFERSGKILALNPNWGGNNTFAHISTIVGSDMGLKLDTNEQTAITITTGGYVGIGTTGPHDGKLVVANSAIDEAYISLQPGGDANNDFVGIRATESGNNSTKLHFGREFTFDNEFVDLLTIDAAGRVGISTTTPGAMLHVSGWQTTEPIFRVAINYYNDALVVSDFGNTHIYRNLYAMQNVGIGTENPNYRLDVRGTIGNNTTLYHSDKRWKKNIKTIDSALETTLALRGVQFEWRRDEFPEMNFSEGKRVGLIAQEVETVIPELVSTGKDGYKSVEYTNLIAVLIEAIKVQQKQIESLKLQTAKLTTSLQKIEELLIEYESANSAEVDKSKMLTTINK